MVGVMSFTEPVPRWWFRTPKTGLPPTYQMVGVAHPLGGVGFLLTLQAEIIDYTENEYTLFTVIPAKLLQVQVVELPSLTVCRNSGWTEEKFTWEPPDLLELEESDTLS